MALQDMLSTFYDADPMLSIPDWRPALVEMSPLIPRTLMEQALSGRHRGQVARAGAAGEQRNHLDSRRSGLDCLLYQYMEPLLSLGRCDGEAGRCQETVDKRQHGTVWSEIVCLPAGFTMKSVDDIEVSADKVTIKLVKRASEAFASIHTVTAVRQIKLPPGVRPTTIKLTWLGNTTLRVTADLSEARESENPYTQATPAGGPRKPSPCECSPDVAARSTNPSPCAGELGCHQKEEAIEAEQQQANTDGSSDGRSDDKVCTLDMGDESEPENEQKAIERDDPDFGKVTSMLAQSGDVNQRPDTLDNVAERGKEHGKEDHAATEASDKPSAMPKLFESNVNIEPFEPEEVKVRLSGSELFIDAVHNDEDGGNTSSFEMHRSISVPRGVDLDQVKCHVADGGKLLISAPYSPCCVGERTIAVYPKNNAD